MRTGIWLQVAATKHADTLDVLDSVDPDEVPGVVLRPEHPPARLEELYARARARTDVLIDPNGFLIDREPTKRSRRHFPWLVQGQGPDAEMNARGWVRPRDTSEWAAWMRVSIVHQQAFVDPQPVSALIVPTPQLRAAEGRDAFTCITDAVDEVLRESDGPRRWVGLNVDRDYLREDDHLTRLGNYAVTLTGSGCVLRAFQTDLPPISDRRFLSGLRDLTSALRGSRIRVFLPQWGWLGWLASAWGADAFSAGLGAGTWYDRMPGPMSAPPRREKYFEPQLLRHVQWGLHELLVRQDGYEPCPCTACDEMGDRFDASLALRHQLEVGIRLSAEAQRNTNAVAETIGSAVEFRDRLPFALRERAEAGFLDTWQSLL